MSHRRKTGDKRKLKRLYEKTKHQYGTGVWYDDRKNRFIRYSCHNTWLKRYCSKITRTRMKNILENSKSKAEYKKIFDYWWNLI